MRPPVIGLTGKARSGKDTVASFLEARIGGYRYSFADPLRWMLSAGFGINMNEPYWQERKEENIAVLGVSPRHMMQTLGTEWGRNCINKDVWVIIAKQRLISKGPGMIIADVRFPNEAAWIRKIGGQVVHVLRDDAPKVAAHESEAGISIEAGDAVITNSGTLEDLQDKVGNYTDGFA